MKKSELTSEWQHALMPVKVRWNPNAVSCGSAEALPTAGRWENRMFVTPAELRHLVPVKRWPTRKQIEGLVDATTT